MKVRFRTAIPRWRLSIGPFAKCRATRVRSSARLGRSVGVVHLEHDARALREQHADALGRLSRLVAGRPAGEPAGRREARAAEAGVARAWIGAIEILGGLPSCRCTRDVMHELAIARRVLDLRDPAVLGEARRDHEASIDVAGARGHRVALRHLKHVIRWSELPAVGEHARRRKLRAVALGRARLDPLHQGGELSVRQAARIKKVPEAGDRLPRRHDTPLDGVADVVLPAERVAVGEQRERRVLAGPMTRRQRASRMRTTSLLKVGGSRAGAVAVTSRTASTAVRSRRIHIARLRYHADDVGEADAQRDELVHHLNGRKAPVPPMVVSGPCSPPNAPVPQTLLSSRRRIV